jgi:hypothetical protein
MRLDDALWADWLGTIIEKLINIKEKEKKKSDRFEIYYF